MTKSLDLTDCIFGDLTAKRRVQNPNPNCKYYTTFWECECTCGNLHITRTDSLVQGRVLSCGCKAHGKTHLLSKTKEYKVWWAMIDRCYNKESKDYINYGGRGITVCDGWKESITKFIEDIGNIPYKRATIDRIDNNGNYCKENCKWSTRKEQNRNTRRNRYLTYNGKTATLAQWSELTGLKRETISMRIRRGMSIKEALTKEVKKENKTWQQSFAMQDEL